jgi:hypothetical protein
MSKTLVLVFIFSCGALYSQDQKKLDESYGFRGIILESTIKSEDSMVLLQETPSINFYKKKGEVLTLGSVKLQEIVYGYTNNQLYFIIIRAHGKDNSMQLLQYLKDEYGKGHKHNSSKEKYTWFAKKAGMVYEYKELIESSEVYIYSKKMYVPK